MASKQYNATFDGENATALEEYIEEHGCSRSQALRHFVTEGRIARQEGAHDEIATDGGVNGYDRFLDQVMLCSLVGVVVSLILALSSPQLQNLEGAFVTFLFVGLGAVAIRLIRDKTQGEGVDPAA